MTHLLYNTFRVLRWWSRANTICYYARLHDGNNAHTSLVTLLTELSRENLFTMSPAGIAGAEGDIFCPDGNMAGAAAVAEMLLQSHKGYIEFIPALPQEWNSGSFEGLCVRGGGVVSAEWNKGKLTSATLTATCDNNFSILIPNDCKIKVVINGVETGTPAIIDRMLSVALHKNDKCEIKFSI